MSSLTSSIFGGGGGGGESGKNELSGLFAASKSLPEREIKVPPRRPPAPTSGGGKKKRKKREQQAQKEADEAKSNDLVNEPELEGDAEGEASGSDREETTAADAHIDGGDIDKGNGSKKAPSKDEESRTVFVGNLPPTTTRRSLKAIFKDCGAVASTRLRSVTVGGVKLPPERAGDQNLMRKVCVNTGRLDPDAAAKAAQGYVVFKSAESVEAALLLNKTVPSTATGPASSALRMRVDRARPSHDASRSVFVGNLPYAADEGSLQKHFANGGHVEDEDIEGVRIVRDAETGKCRGFAYVLLTDRGSVGAALRMHGTVYLRKPIRVMVCGKRFKGRRGAAVPATEDGDGKTSSRKFEGKRATETRDGVQRRLLDKKRKAGYTPVNTSTISTLGVEKKKRLRGATFAEKNKKAFSGAGRGGRKPGVSKRAASEAKLNKREKKIKKRIAKGMGKTK